MLDRVGAIFVALYLLVSFHAHEYGDDEEAPAEFLPAFAYRMIDEGASVVVGHGPHLLRGMEIYKGCPIFYSLGNFVGQNELVSRLPADSYERFRVDPQLTPGMVFKTRTDNDRKSFPADRRFWETAVEQGWTALAVPEAQGGLGLGRIELGLVAQASGAATAGAPFLTSSYGTIRALLAADAELPTLWLPVSGCCRTMILEFSLCSCAI